MITSMIQAWSYALIITQIVLLTMQWTGYISWPVWKYLLPTFLFFYNVVWGASCICYHVKKEKEKGKSE